MTQLSDEGLGPVRLLRRFEEVYGTQKGMPWIGVVRPEQAFGRAANLLEELVETLRAARVIIVEDANACRAFRDESEESSGPENVLAKIDDALAKAKGDIPTLR